MPNAQGLAAKIDFLRQPVAYPDHPKRVEVVETHMSLVFLTDHYAYKLKKPVRYEFLDFSTPEARRVDCEEEVRLNRRLAHDVYLGVIPLTARGDQLRIGGWGRCVDWLVHMRRLPASRMLDAAILSKTVTIQDVRRFATALAGFYLRAVPAGLSAAEYRARPERDIGENYRELSKDVYGLPTQMIEEAAARLLAFIHRFGDLLGDRVQAGHVIEGHGDLRPEHICLINHPVVIDCLEFNRDLRLLDPASELAFLTMECERLRATWVGDVVFEVYRAVTCDRPVPALVAFYGSCHALLRAKIAIWHNRDSPVHAPERWFQKALWYIGIANRDIPTS
jgi:aminoglycoside phosphotransferase family enzyme